MVMLSVVSTVMLNILVVVLTVMTMEQYPDSKSHFVTLWVQGVDGEVLVSFMKSNRSVHLKGKTIPSRFYYIFYKMYEGDWQ